MGVIVFDRKGRILKDTVDYDALRRAFVEMVADRIKRRGIYAELGLLNNASAGGAAYHYKPGGDGGDRVGAHGTYRNRPDYEEV